MKRTVISLFALQFLFLLWACNNDKNPASENEEDAARNFLDAALDGKWNNAKGYLVQDSVNVQLLETVENKYNKLPNAEKLNYSDAHPIFYAPRKVNDSIIIMNYSNSYTNRRDSLKIVRMNGQWLVDLKYSFFHTDSLGNVQ